MGLKQQQQALARLYTDAALRAKFRANPRVASAALGLTVEEANQIASIPSQKIDRFAQSLHRKRADEVRTLLPYTCRALGESFETLFTNHADQYCPQGCHKHQDDALRFAKFLCNPMFYEKVAACVIDIVRFESTVLRVHESKTRLFVRIFRHDVRQLIRKIDDGQQIADKAHRLSFGIWIRFRSLKRSYFIMTPRLHRGTRDESLSIVNANNNFEA